MTRQEGPWIVRGVQLGRTTKRHVMISLSIPLDLIEEVDKIVEKSGKPRSRVICELIERALDLGAYYD